MNTDDLILVSIDDHVVEPPDMFLRHVPAKYKDEAPVVVTDDKGVDQWMYQGRPQGAHRGRCGPCRGPARGRRTRPGASRRSWRGCDPTPPAARTPPR